ncbi:MAG: transketolase [Clostridia bacterium]
MANIEWLQNKSKQIRNDIIDMVYSAGSGHLGGSLSCVDILVCLYHEIMNLENSIDGTRVDKFVLSKGHGAPAYYAVLASKGFIPEEDLKNLRRYDSYLEGHPSNKINGVDSSSGSLGQGLSIANGMALANKISGRDGYVYALLGDGEMEEGQVWEALMSANKYNLSSLIMFIDNNGLQIDGTIKSVKKLENLEEKIKSFGLNVETIDGHSHRQIIDAINRAKLTNMPTCIIAKTIKGKGVSFMENDASWHGKSLDYDHYKMAKAELDKELIR